MSDRIFFSVLFYNFGFYYGHNNSIDIPAMLGGTIGIILGVVIYYKVIK